MTYEIRSRETGRTVATVDFDPYDFDMRVSADGLRSLLAGVEDVRQMNRTAGDDPEAPGSTSLETYQDPSTEFLKDEVFARVQPGFAMVKV